MISKIELQKFQTNLMLELCLRLELLELILNFYSLGVTSFLFIFLEMFLLFTFFLEFTLFFPFFSQQKLPIIAKPKNHVAWGEVGECNYENPKFH